MKCTYLKEDGIVCEANAIRSSNLCVNHNPEYKDVKLMAVIKGGLNRRLSEAYGEPVEIRSPRDVKELLAKTINGVWTGKIPAGQPANTIGFLSRCYLDAYEQTELEERLSALEKKLEEGRGI